MEQARAKWMPVGLWYRKLWIMGSGRSGVTWVLGEILVLTSKQSFLKSPNKCNKVRYSGKLEETQSMDGGRGHLFTLPSPSTYLTSVDSSQGPGSGHSLYRSFAPRNLQLSKWGRRVQILQTRPGISQPYQPSVTSLHLPIMRTRPPRRNGMGEGGVLGGPYN